MIKLTYKQLRAINQDGVLIQKLRCTPLPTKLSYTLHKLLEKLADAVEVMVKDEAEFAKTCREKYTVKGEDGAPKKTDDGQGFILQEGVADALRADQVEFGNREIVIDRLPIPLHLLEGAVNLKLSVAEMATLEPLLIDLGVAPPVGSTSDRGSLQPSPSVTPDSDGDGPQTA